MSHSEHTTNGVSGASHGQGPPNGKDHVNQEFAGWSTGKAEQREGGAATLDFDGHTIRKVEIDGEWWFVAADVCAALNHSSPTHAVARLDEDEKALTTIQGEREANIVNESGLYALMLTSRKAEADRFRRWIKREVLLSIRRTGRYDGSRPSGHYEKGRGYVVTLSAQGSYAVTIRGSGQIDASPTRDAEPHKLGSDNLVRLLCHTILALECYWQDDRAHLAAQYPSERARVNRLDTAMLEAGRLCRHYLDWYRAAELGQPLPAV